MLEIKNNKVTDSAAAKAARGSGLLGSTKDYLKGDLTSYYYNKFKTEQNPYLIDEMWAEAAKRGESEQLIKALELSKEDEGLKNIYDNLQKYGGRMDYDTYMLTLSLPTLDNETIEDIKNAQGDSLGSYTKRGYAIEVLTQMQKRWDAEIVEENKDTRNWFVKAMAPLASLASGVNHLASGVLQFGQDIVNLAEGLYYAVADEKTFLDAFANDEGELLADLKRTIDVATFEFERMYTSHVNAITAYEQGYIPGSGDTMAKIVDTTVNTGVGYTTWGRWWAAGTESIGYMLPSMLLPIKGASGLNFGKAINASSFKFGSTIGKSAAKSVAKYGANAAGISIKAAAGIKNAVFYSGVFSGMISDTVKLTGANGISYKDLNTGEVIANAALKTLAQVGVEKALGLVMGFSGLDKLMGATAKSGGSGDTAKMLIAAGQKGVKANAKAAGTALLRGAKDMLKEGLEETLQDLSNGLIDIVSGGIYVQQGMETISVQNLVDSFVVGALTSGVIGAVRNASVILPRNRAIGITDSGETFKLGTFQTLNYNEAVRTLADWREVLNDRNASTQEKVDAAFKLNTVLATVGNVMKSFGTTRAIAANNLLGIVQNKKGNYSKYSVEYAEKEAISYAKQLFSNFEAKTASIHATHIIQSIKKAKDALKDKETAEKLQDANVSAVTNVIDELTKPNETTDLSDASLKKMQAALKPLGVSLIVGINGNVVVRSGDIIFADDALVKTGNIAEIVKGISYEDLIADITASIKKDKNILTFIKNSYKNVTGNDPHSDQAAVTALLFDQNFYLYCLLNATESGHNDILKSLSKAIITVDHKIRSKSLLVNKVLQQAYKTLFEKVVKNMQNALLTYYTQHQRLNILNLNEITKSLITEEMRKIILEHKNVVFSNNIDNAVKTPNDKIGTQTRAQWFETQISKFLGFRGGQFDDIIKQAIADMKTTSIDKRRDAASTLVILTEFNATLPSEQKLSGTGTQITYLPLNIPTDTIFTQIKTELENETGLSFNELRTGTISEGSTPTAEFVNYLKANGYIFADRESRLTAIKEMVYNKSGGKYTLSSIGEVLTIIERQDFLKSEYLSDENKLSQDIQSGKITKIGDILKPGVKLSAPFKQIQIVYNSKITGMGRSINGTTIEVGKKHVIDTIMHEFTHCLQDDINAAIVNTGGTDKMFAKMAKNEKADLDQFIKDKYPIANKLLDRLGASSTEIKIYRLLDGELQACSNTNSIIFECGFTLNKDKTKLYAPNGREFSLVNKRDTSIANKRDISQRAEFDREKAMSYLTKLIAFDNKQRFAKEDKALKYNTSTARINKSQSLSESKKMSEALGGEITKRPLNAQDIKRSIDALTSKSGEVLKAIDTPMKHNVIKQGYSELEDKALLGTEQQRIDAIELSQGKMKMPSPLDKRYKRRYSYGTVTAELNEADRVNEENKARDKNGKSRIITKKEFDAKTAFGTDDEWRDNQKQVDQYNAEIAEYEKAIAARKRLIRKAEKRQAKLSDKDRAKKEAAIRYTILNRPAISRSDYVKTPKPRYYTKESMINAIGNKNVNINEILAKNRLTDNTKMAKVFDNNEGYSSYKSRGFTEEQADKAYVNLMHGQLGTRALRDLTASMNVSKALKQTKSDTETKKLTRSEIQAELLNRIIQLHTLLLNKDLEKSMTRGEIAQLRTEINDKLEKMSNAEIRRYYNDLLYSDELAKRPMTTGEAAELRQKVNKILKAHKDHISQRLAFDPQRIEETKGLRTITPDEPSLLSNFYRKGKQYRLPKILCNFVEAVTPNIDKVDEAIREYIENGKLRLEIIDNYVASSKHINDFTFKAIAKYIYLNDEVAEMTYDEMIELLLKADSVIAAGRVYQKAVEYDTETDIKPFTDKFGYEGMMGLLDTITDATEQDDKIKAMFDEYQQKANIYYFSSKDVDGTIQGGYEPTNTEEYEDQLHLKFMRTFNGSVYSLNAINRYGQNLILKQKTRRTTSYVDDKTKASDSDVAYETGIGWLDYKRTATIDYNDNKADLSEDNFKKYVSQNVPRVDMLKTIYSARKETFIENEKNKVRNRGEAWTKESRTAALEQLKSDLKKLSNIKLAKIYIETLQSSDIRTIDEKRIILAGIEAKQLVDDFELDARRDAGQIAQLQEDTLQAYEQDYSDAEIERMYSEQIATNTELGSELTTLYQQFEKVEKAKVNVRESLLGDKVKKRPLRQDPTPYGTHSARQTQIDTIRHTVNDRLLNTTNGLNSQYAIKSDYEKLPDTVKAVLDKKSPYSKYYKFNDKYLSMSQEELEQLSHDVSEAATKIIQRQKSAMKLINQTEQTLAETETKLAETEAKLQEANKKLKATRSELNKVKKKGTKAVTKTYEYKVSNIVVDAHVPVADTPDIVNKIMHTTWNKQKKSQVQELTDNIDYVAKNGESFYKENNEAFFSMTLSEAELAAEWFMESSIPVNQEGADVFEAVRFYFMGFLYREMQPGGQFENMQPNIKQQISTFMTRTVHTGATIMGMWNGLKDKLDPMKAIFSARLEIAGVELTRQEQDNLLEAAKSNDINKINKIQAEIINRIKAEKLNKNTIGKSILTIRNMSMLSSPLTWLRNRVSNFMLKRLNKWSSVIGNKIWTKKTDSDQLKMTKAITPEITKFINENFVDNGLFSSIVENLSKYNPSDVQNRFKTAYGTIDKEAIFANMVIKSMYNKFYNENMFSEKFGFLTKVHQFLMKQLSDNNYVREAALRYFGQIIAERGYKLSEGVTDEVMTDFANAIGMGMSDYMHSDNFLNAFERIIAEKGAGWQFAYKLLMPFAATSWNWMKAAVRYSPAGLIKSIYQLATLERTIGKATASWDKGKSQISPELTEFLIRRNLGSGLIGTVALFTGVLLAALGAIRLEDDDYGKPKLRVGPVAVDVSQIFGTSSLLAGAAFVSTIKNSDGFIKAMDNTLDVMLDGFFLTDIMNLDLYSGGGTFATGLDFLESTALSFIPNAFAYIAGATYVGELKKDNLFWKACAKIPFLANVVPKKVDPYSGETGGFWNLFSRVVPYIDVEVKSNVSKMSEAVGLSKTQLTGEYTINDESFKLSTHNTAKLNKQYGEWNAKALTDFYSNKSRHRVNVNGTYKELTYDQMTDKQRKAAANGIMTENAKYAKILAWLSKGNKYYASDTEYNALRKLGVRGKLYKGNKGFVKA